MTLPVIMFGWSLFVAILLLAVLSGALQPRPILFVAISGSGLLALIFLILIFAETAGAAR